MSTLRDVINANNRAHKAEQRAQSVELLLIEALARLETLDRLLGDPGGPFYARDAGDLITSMRWISAVRSDPPAWGDDEHDPLVTVQDLAMTKAVDNRAQELLARIRNELFRYYDRVERQDPDRAAAWRPWWRGARHPDHPDNGDAA